jgi:excisionase family DNA binding protein
MPDFAGIRWSLPRGAWYNVLDRGCDMQDDKPTPDVLTLDEAARYLRVNERTVRGMLKDKRLPGTKIGRAWRLRRADLDKVLAGQARLDRE